MTICIGNPNAAVPSQLHTFVIDTERNYFFTLRHDKLNDISKESISYRFKDDVELVFVLDGVHALDEGGVVGVGHQVVGVGDEGGGAVATAGRVHHSHRDALAVAETPVVRVHCPVVHDVASAGVAVAGHAVHFHLFREPKGQRPKSIFNY